MRASSLARRRQHVVAFRTLSLSRQYSRGIARSSRALLTPCVASRVGHDKTTAGRECVAAEEESSPSTRERFYSNTFAAVLAFAVGVLPLSSHAVGPVKVTLSDAHIEKIECADFKQGALGQGSKACFRVTAQADNPSKKELRNSDVFGKVYDRAGNAALDDTENIRIAYLGTVVPGKSEVSFTLSVPASEETDRIEIRGLKASGFTGGVLPGQGSGLVTDCDEFTPPEECETLPF